MRVLSACVIGLAAISSLSHAQWLGPTGAQNLMYYNNGNGYIGTPGFTNPAVRFDVVDNAQSSRVIGLHSYIGTPSNNERTTAIWGETNNPAGRALQGFNFATTGNGAGIWAESASSTGSGIRARATATSGLNYGGHLETSSSTGVALYAQSTSAIGNPVAVYGSVSSTSGLSGYFLGGSCYFNTKVGIGLSTPLNYFTVLDSRTTGVVLGDNFTGTGGSATSGPAGVTGQASESNAGAFSSGVRGYSLSSTFNGVGVLGYHAHSGYGIFGKTGNSAGFAGYFDGKVQVVGNLSKGGGSFKIDHPLDPKNKYLSHSFVESPDMMNIYNGNIVTDQDGYATVTLPEWFETLNRDFRYQLTVIDESDAGWTLAKVVRKVHKNQFTIRTNYPNVEVSWLITGVRQDNFANANRIPVEEDKESWNKGRYLHPAAFGASEELAVTYQRDEKGNPVAATRANAPVGDPVARNTYHANPLGVSKAAEPALIPAVAGGR